MTDLEQKDIEDARKRRENELLIVLLLLLGAVVPQSLVNANPFDAFRRLMLARAVRELARSMAEAHLDAFALANGFRLPGVDELIDEYTPSARVSITKLADSIDEQRQASGGVLTGALLLAKHSRTDSTNLGLGIERNIVTASNAGRFDGVVSREGIDGVTGLRHVSVLDDRTSKICEDRDGLQLPLSDPYWELGFPSLHFRCRSVLDPLTGSFEPSEWRPTVPPDVGFGKPPPGVLALLRRKSRGRAA